MRAIFAAARFTIARCRRSSVVVDAHALNAENTARFVMRVTHLFSARRWDLSRRHSASHDTNAALSSRFCIALTNRSHLTTFTRHVSSSRIALSFLSTTSSRHWKNAVAKARRENRSTHRRTIARRLARSDAVSPHDANAAKSVRLAMRWTQRMIFRLAAFVSRQFAFHVSNAAESEAFMTPRRNLSARRTFASHASRAFSASSSAFRLASSARCLSATTSNQS